MTDPRGIYRGPGGPGDATADTSNESIIAVAAAAAAESSKNAAAASASAAAASAASAATSSSNASTQATNAASSAAAASISASSAATSVTNAQTAETNAETAEANAEIAQAAAELAESNAQAYELSANEWATKTSGPVAGGEYSAKYNAQLAAISESNASSSASSASSSAASASSSASTATTKAAEAATSASNASTSATNAANSATSAANSATTATTQATNASNSATSAASSATTATTKASESSVSATNAATSESNAAGSASSAASSATTATTKAGEASASASSASASATSASNSAASASSSETNAAASASTATTKASEASSSASAAATSASNAATSETNAANSASSANTSEVNAASSASSAASSASSASSSATAASAAQSAAETARDQTLAAYDNFDDRYLGAKTSDPSVDNDGNTLIAGALYFNSSLGYMKVYTGTIWVDAYAAGTSFLAKANNLSDLPSVSSARSNLGLGTAATTASTDYATAAQGANADTAYGWGNHASAGYLTSYTETDPIYTASSWYTTTNNSSNWNTAYSWGNHASAGYLTSYTETDPIYTASSWYTTTNNSSNWDTAYSWGNHASAGYLDSSDVGVSVQAYDSNLTSFVSTFTLPTTDGSNGQVLGTNGSGTLSFITPSTVGSLDDLSDVTITSPSNGQVLSYNGTAWVNATGGGGASLPSQTGNSGKFLTTDGTNASWAAVPKFDYFSSSNPAYNTNPTIQYATWLNTSTGAIWFCTNNTTGLNVWKRIGYSETISASTVFDIFGDSSAVALYQFTSGALGTDTGGTKTMTTVGGSATTGLIGDAWEGGGSYMKNGNSMNNNLVISVSAWFNVTNTGGNWVWSSGKTANGQCKRGVRLSGNTIDVCSFSNEYAGGFSTTFTYGQWTHVCVAREKVYVNGSYVGSIGSYSGPTSDTYGFYIGANGAYDYGYVTNETYGQPMNGKIDQLRVFNRELTASEVALLYSEGSS